jgi:hypothetical protein
VESVECACGSEANREAVNRVAIIGAVPVPRDERNYRQSFAEYREAVAEVADGYERVNRDRAPGERIREPDYYERAKAQAIAKGVPIL